MDLSVNKHGIEATQIQEQTTGFESLLNPPKNNYWAIFFVSSGLDLVIYCANVWNEREADNVRERRDFEDDEVKSHLGLSSAQPSIVPYTTVISAHLEKRTSSESSL